MWLLGRLQSDYKSVAEFRRMRSQAVTEAGAELVRLARSVGLVKGDTVAVDGSKFRAVSSAKSVREREAMKRYLEQLDAADEQDEVVIDPSAVQAALEKLQNDPEPEARFMRMGSGHAPAYNVQTAVDAEHALIVAHKITDTAGDNSLLLPMAEACEAQGIVPHVPVTRAVNNQGDGTLFDRNEFHYDEKTDTFRCPANQTLTRKQLSRKDRAVYYAAKPEVCGACALKMRCTNRRQRLVSRHLHEDAFQRMQQRATPEMMRLRRSTVEHPFASLKYHIFGHPRFLLRGLKGAQTEISLATT